MWRSGRDFHAFPKCQVTFNVFCSFLRLRVVPGSILVDLVVYHNIIVTCAAFPAAHRRIVAGTNKRMVQGVGWKVVIALNHHSLITFCYDSTLPNSFHRTCPLGCCCSQEWLLQSCQHIQSSEFFAVQQESQRQMSRMCSEENAYVIDTGRYITWHAHIRIHRMSVHTLVRFWQQILQSWVHIYGYDCCQQCSTSIN